MEHVTFDAAIRYVSGRKSEEEETDLETHVAACEGCLHRVQGLQFLRANFDAVWDSWTAAEHGRLYRQWRVADALEKVAHAQPSLAAKAREWLGRLGRTPGLAVKLLLDHGRRIAMAAPDHLLPEDVFLPQFTTSGVGAGEERDRVEKHLAESCELLSEGSDEAAVEQLSQVVNIDARAAQAAHFEVSRSGRLVLRVGVESRRRSLSVRYWPSQTEPVPGIVMLVPEDSSILPLATTFQFHDDMDYAVAEFRDVPDGVYSLWIGPDEPTA